MGPGRPSQAQGDGRGPGGSGASGAVTFSARDSLVIVTDSATGDHGSLYGEASMSHQGATLRARTIEMNFKSGTLDASGPPSDTARNARPVFERSASGGGGDARGLGGGGSGGGGQSFTGETLSYNINTRRGRVVSARTQRQDGYIQGGAVKVFEDSTLFVQGGLYTTCNCPPGHTPSYSLRSSEMKVQDKWVYTGPIQLFLFNVPTPLWLPFGFLPNTQGRRSGPLPPNYGQDQQGLFLKDWGWYFALNDYTDLTLRAGVWSQGSFEIRPRFRYAKRYNYDGDLDFTYRRVRIGEPEDPSFQDRHEGELDWTHNQTLSPTASLNGSINLATSSDFAQRNSDNYDDALRQDVSSSINYRKRWPQGGRQFNLSANQQQQFQSGEVSLTAPDLSFSQNRFKPFARDRAVGEPQWYEKITTSYDFDLTNNFNFTPRDPEQLRQRGDTTLARQIEEANVQWYDALFDRDQYQLATGDDELFDFQATHRIPLSASFRIDRFNMSISPNANYTSDWYINTVRVVDTSDTGERFETAEETTPGFYARHNFNTSLSASAEAYGTFPLEVGPFEGVRHRLSPSLSANYQPDFNRPFWGRTRPLRTPDGTPVVDPETGEPRRYDILTGSLVRSSTEQRNLNFSLRNVFETKRVRVDSTGERETDRITLLNLDLQGLSYNFAADSFRVGNNIQLNARTTVERFDITMNSSFSPYALRPSGTVEGETRYRSVDRYMIAESPWTPARLTNFRLGVSGQFQSGDAGGRAAGSGGFGTRRTGRQTGARAGGPQRRSGRPSGRTSQGAPDELRALDLPWSLSFDFNYRLSKPQKEVTSRTATLGSQFSLGLTSKWRIQGRSGYDFVQGELATTRLSTSRVVGSCDCWVMSFSWVPFGRYQSYSFNLQVRSGQLSQLLQLQLPNAGGEGRLGGFGDRLRGTVQGAAGGGRFP
jgi:hypothetical protein